LLRHGDHGRKGFPTGPEPRKLWRMKVVHFVHRFSPLTQTFVYGLVCGMRAANPETGVLTLKRENADSRPFDAVHDIEVVGLNEWSSLFVGRLPVARRALSRLDRWRVRRRQIAALREYLDWHRPDVLHAHFAEAGKLIASACEATGTPLIVSLRGYDASRELHRARKRRSYRRLFGKARAVVLVSEEMRSRIGPLVPSGVPVVTIHAGKRDTEYTFREPRGPIKEFLSIGRLVEKKGHLDAIRAVAEARRMGVDVNLRIIGDGRLRRELEDFVNRSGLREFVDLAGEMGHDSVKAALHAAGGCILACRTGANGDKEGIPNVLKEAQLIGVPIVSTMHGGIPDVVPQANQRWLAPEGDWMMLARLIHELAGMDESALRQIAIRGRRHVEEHFSLAEEVRRHLDLYNAVINRRIEMTGS
jgi:colanic acid/amylovoran biosynthesis glycosyltransferase